MKTTAPYGEWISPISAADLTVGARSFAGARLVRGGAWWSELRGDEGGRYAVARFGDEGSVVDVLRAPWNARSRVHEYGGGAWTVTDDAVLVFVEFEDQRLYRVVEGGSPEPLTPGDGGFRFGELSVVGDRVLAVRETNGARGVERDIVLVPLNGSAADDAERIVSVVGGSHFLTGPRVSPDGSRLAWIAWDHPNMPWDATELRVGRLGGDGRVTDWEPRLGGPQESVLQPEWLADGTLVASSDRTGWWNLYRVPASGGPEALDPREAEVGGPLWQLGSRWYALRPGGSVVFTATQGTDSLWVLEPSGDTRRVPVALTSIGIGPIDGERMLSLCGDATRALSLCWIDLTTGAVEEVRSGVDRMPDLAVLPELRLDTFGTRERPVHAIVAAPRNEAFEAPASELPPYVAFVHGGPTGQADGVFSLLVAYFTSRGIGVIDVDYGGSTGYGRPYRERLKGQWGVVDVEDVVTAVTGLADAGLADRARLAIEGGSAGGWTVLAALTGTDVFACGASYFGVAELVRFAEETHDFESRYLDGLIGPLPEARGLYESRAPVNRVADLRTPVLLLQGLDDPIVPPSQAERFRDAMIENGIPHAYIAYEGESHGFRKAENVISSRESELSFYGQVMGFVPHGVREIALWHPAS